ncbi:PEP-CTERM sorting domain-containing protein [Flocculibacter collagenilyticus]|uniref:PEP-CTERM sorting domain-containing protein n=1 Tax=Flocculibacter collagenilyticus TaxID=2744479 RepID=UPI0018F58BFE|nr:PEP-CTERM sorting domain-containing protein [Flocculibacter collagenilyticus]
MNKKITSQLSSIPKLIVSLIILLTGNVNLAYAGLIHFDINRSITLGEEGNTTHIGANCHPGHIGAVIDGESLILDPGCSKIALDVQLTQGEFWIIPGSDNSLNVLNYNDTIDATHFFSGGRNAYNYAMIFNKTTPHFRQSFSSKYLGFLTRSGKYGYIEVSWSYKDQNDVGTLSFIKGAYQDTVGASIKAGNPIPEPATWALIIFGLLGLIITRTKP